MITCPRLRTVRRGAAALRLALMLLAGAALLASCAAPPQSEPAAQPAQPSAARSSHADQPQPAAAAPTKTETPAEPAQPTAVEPARAEPAQARATPPAKAEPESPPTAPEAQPAAGAGAADEPEPARWSVGARAPRQERQAAVQVKPANADPPQKPQREPVAPPTRVKPRGDEGEQVRPVAAGGSQDRPRGNLRSEPGQAKPEAKTPATKKEAGCGAKGGTREPDPQPSPEGPQPRWVCKEPKVTAESVWSGQPVDFVFEIANEGDGDLKIKLKKP